MGLFDVCMFKIQKGIFPFHAFDRAMNSDKDRIMTVNTFECLYIKDAESSDKNGGIIKTNNTVPVFYQDFMDALDQLKNSDCQSRFALHLWQPVICDVMCIKSIKICPSRMPDIRLGQGERF